MHGYLFAVGLAACYCGLKPYLGHIAFHQFNCEEHFLPKNHTVNYFIKNHHFVLQLLVTSTIDAILGFKLLEDSSFQDVAIDAIEFSLVFFYPLFLLVFDFSSALSR